MPFGAQNRDGRTFIDGEDSRWTAIHGAPSTNAQVNFYNETLARTANGLLVMEANSNDAVFVSNGTTFVRSLQTPMLQTWNKFCFSEGAVEISAK